VQLIWAMMVVAARAGPNARVEVDAAAFRENVPRGAPDMRSTHLPNV